LVTSHLKDEPKVAAVAAGISTSTDPATIVEPMVVSPPPVGVHKYCVVVETAQARPISAAWLRVVELVGKMEKDGWVTTAG
jgi:hypothetical protein